MANIKSWGQAPYGEPKYKDVILNKLIDLKDDGSFKLDMNFFNYATGLTMINKNFEKLFGRSARKPESELLDQFHMDIASSVKAATEEIVLKLTKDISKKMKLRIFVLLAA